MDALFEILTLPQLVFAMIIAVFAGFVKGVVGFALPMIFVSGLSTFLSPELALAGLILPTVVTNMMQAFRQGMREAWNSAKRFRVFLGVGLVALLIGAQLVRLLPLPVMLIAIGLPVTAYAMLQLLGVELKVNGQSNRVAASVGALAGFMGGLSGIWGPPTVAYLTALKTDKNDYMRIQGVIYGLGAVALVVAHTGSGVLRTQTLPLSLAMVPPAVLGLWLGGRVLDRIDHVLFRRATLVVLLVAGINLVRRALFS
jgi:uncharacterized membrane protein YfcA